MKRLIKTPFLLIFIFALLFSLLLYKESLNYYFFQDDFFEINISKAQNLKEYLEFFKPRDDIIAYRPISLQNYFFFSGALFGLNPMGFRLITLIFFISSAFLIGKIALKLTKDVRVGLLASSIWIVSSIHFMAIGWIAAAYNIIGTFFWLLTSLFFLKFHQERKWIFYYITLATFLLTIGSFEFSVTWPAIFGFYYFFVLKNTLFKSLKIFLPFIVVTILYLVMRVLLISIPQIPEYRVSLNLDSLKALLWYVLWAFNIPEEFKKQIINNLLIFNPKFLSEYWFLVVKTFVGAIWLATLGILLPIFYIAKNKISANWRLVIFFFVWFTAGISPVLLLPNHTFTMYLTLPSIGVYLMISYLLMMSKRTILAFPLFIIWIATSITTLNFYKINSWMIEAQRTAQKASVNLKMAFPRLPQGSVVYYRLNSHWESQALAQNHSIQVFYNDQTLSIYYNKEALLADFKKDIKGPIYIYFPE